MGFKMLMSVLERVGFLSRVRGEILYERACVKYFSEIEEDEIFYSDRR